MTRQTRKNTSGPLAGYTKVGRRHLSPMAATGLLQIGDWVRDALPDLIWPSLVLELRGNRAARDFVDWQAAVGTALQEVRQPTELAEGLDGRLTSLDQLARSEPAVERVIRESAQAHGLLADPVVSALSSYSDRPARWLIEGHEHAPEVEDLRNLAASVTGTLRDDHREALIKCLSIWSAVGAGTFRSDNAMRELLKSYPKDAATRAMADSVVRASWGARQAASVQSDPEYLSASVSWAKAFWDTNSRTTWCSRRSDREFADPTARTSDKDVPDGGGGPTDEGSALRQFAMDLGSSYVEALDTAPAHLYDKAKQEVHSGLVMRACREVITALGAPDLWCTEHGAHVGRMLAEVRITLQWMSTQDPAIYEKYQSYGQGKAKLHSRIFKEIPIEFLSLEAVNASKELDRLAYDDALMEHRVVDTADSFANGKSLRAMAEECGQLDLYRHLYQMASGVAHSEWWSVELHYMERCLNVLHGGHLIPSLSLSSGGSKELASAWADLLHSLIRFSLKDLGTDQASVSAAFAWVSDAASSRSTGNQTTGQRP